MTFRFYKLITGWFLTVLPVVSIAQPSLRQDLVARLQSVIDTSHAKVGVGIAGLDFSFEASINGDVPFPMQSVYKFPLAIVVLDRVDKGQLSLTKVVHIPRQDLDTNTWSPMVREHPRQDIDMTVADLLRYSVSKSDNNACDILFDVVGGTQPVDNYLRRKGINGIAIKATEAQMRKDWEVQYNNACLPASMLHLLRKFYDGGLLSKNSNTYLMRLMTETENAPGRIKALLPKEAVVAHKTGSSGTNAEGVTAACNDVGIVTLPNGKHIALVVFVSDYRGDMARGEGIIAALSKMAWDFFK